ncbi:acetylcholine receptor subunit alpha-1-B-like [Ptychodera flava]|uniref:acetylcholine receptor subunit alpha-1-B-like n=1 Tax=Ptychodera flava TaxID=63121 RepID=UPI003969E02D
MVSTCPNAWLLKVVILFLVAAGVACQSHEKQIVDSLLGNYDKRLRPVKNDSTVTIVTVDVSVKHAINMQNRKQVLNALIDLTLFWNDEYLRWYPENYGDVQRIVLPSSEIWIPDIRLYNNVDDSVDNYAANILASVYYDGNATLSWRPIFAEVACRVSVQPFPLDTQVCELPYGSWMYDNRQIVVKQRHLEMNISEFAAVGEFYMTNSTSMLTTHSGKDGRMYSLVKFLFVLERKSVLYATCYILPCIVISLMMTLSFIIPYKYGIQKISIGVTLFLTGIVYLQSVIKILPATTDQQILLSQYYMSMLVVLSSGTLINVLSLIIANIGECGKREVPWLLRKICFLDDKRMGTSARNPAINLDDLHNDSRSTSSVLRRRSQGSVDVPQTTSLSQTLTNIEGVAYDILRSMRQHKKSSAHKARIVHEWKTVAKTLDRVCLFAYLTEIIVVNVVVVFRAKIYVESYINIDNSDSWSLA